MMPISFTKAFSKTTIVIPKDRNNPMLLLLAAIWEKKTYLCGFQLTCHLYLHQKQRFA